MQCKVMHRDDYLSSSSTGESRGASRSSRSLNKTATQLELHYKQSTVAEIKKYVSILER